MRWRCGGEGARGRVWWWCVAGMRGLASAGHVWNMELATDWELLVMFDSHLSLGITEQVSRFQGFLRLRIARKQAIDPRSLLHTSHWPAATPQSHFPPDHFAARQSVHAPTWSSHSLPQQQPRHWMAPLLCALLSSLWRSQQQQQQPHKQHHPSATQRHRSNNCQVHCNWSRLQLALLLELLATSI